MKNIKTTLLLSTVWCCAFIFNGCETKTTYCTFVLRSNRCDISKDIQNLCFKCNGTTCPDIAMKQVYLKKGEKDSCLVSIGNKISDCGQCAPGDSIVELLSIAQ
ncbi:hypothetical protein [Dinghuibacter silviterrae]|uniref:Uncharacterized protein n=1 Tax=Dinghuibacter silviterrae TaxID=1539049 RepID=A0A4R8DM80_9BACT|nr:hypothetical protein [Dinghuibacter silviterrae]TDW99071.1 hypothetical protein EDB95_0079 [Dinghuibacter silviterrae]